MIGVIRTDGTYEEVPESHYSALDGDQLHCFRRDGTLILEGEDKTPPRACRQVKPCA